MWRVVTGLVVLLSSLAAQAQTLPPRDIRVAWDYPQDTDVSGFYLWKKTLPEGWVIVETLPPSARLGTTTAIPGQDTCVVVQAFRTTPPEKSPDSNMICVTLPTIASATNLRFLP